MGRRWDSVIHCGRVEVIMQICRLSLLSMLRYLHTRMRWERDVCVSVCVNDHGGAFVFCFARDERDETAAAHTLRATSSHVCAFFLSFPFLPFLTAIYVCFVERPLVCSSSISISLSWGLVPVTVLVCETPRMTFHRRHSVFHSFAPFA